MYNLIFSLITFVIALFFILLGVISVLIPWSEVVRQMLIDAISHNSLAISLFGFAFIVIGFTVVFDILINSRKSYYRIKSGRHDISVDETVVQQYITASLKELFLDSDIPSRLKLKNNRFHITIDLPHQSSAMQSALLEQIKEELQRQFASQLGYKEEFFLSASFQPAPKNQSLNE